MQQSELMGKWELVSWTHKSIKDKTIHFPFGVRPKGVMEFTENEFMSFARKHFRAIESNTKTHSPLYNEDVLELSISGTYELIDNNIIFHYKECSIPQLKQEKRERHIWFDDHQTMIISGQSTIEGEDYSIKATLIRVV